MLLKSFLELYQKIELFVFVFFFIYAAKVMAISMCLQGNVEVWLGDLLKMSKKSIHGIIRSAAISILDPGFKLIEFENMFPAQVKKKNENKNFSFQVTNSSLN